MISIFWLLATATVSSAFKSSFRRSRTSLQTLSAASTHKSTNFAAQGDNNALDLNTVQDLLYMANVTVEGTQYVVQLDTGSSDLWLKGPVANANPTSIEYNLTYGIGWAYGQVSYGKVDFAGLSIPSQAFLDASSVQNPALNYGAQGILGLGFTSLSTVDALVNKTGSSAGRSLLYNLFSVNPSEPNFITFSLQRSTEPGDEVEGTFSVGEYESQYGSIANNAPISTWPIASPKRWTVLVDALLLNGGASVTPSTTIPNAPSNKAVALIDSGTSWSYVPEDICNAIYGNVSGASFNSQTQTWDVPCDAEIDIALQIGGQVFPIHPLDVTPTSLTDPKKCSGSFVPQSVAVGSGEFDWLVGDNFLRSVYSLYDFGDFDQNQQMGNPYIKLLTIVDPDQASSEFAKVRNTTPKTGLTYNAANNSDADPGSTSITLSTDVAKTLDKIGTYFPVMLGLMGLNALVIIALVVVAITYMCRGRRKRVRAARMRTPTGRLTPMPTSRNSYVAGTPPPDQHIYEPISMALTDDTMLNPPSPGFHKFEGRAGDRPQSLATLPSQSKLYQQIGSEEALVAPSPSFFNGGGRPKSVGMPPSAQPNFVTGQQPEDEPFTPPTMVHPDSYPADNVSLRSGKSGKSFGDEGLPPSDAIPLVASVSRPSSVMNMDRPRSIVVPPPTTQSPEDTLMPPSPGLSTGFITPASGNPPAVNSSQAPRYPPPPIPHSASPRFAGSGLRPNHATLTNMDRPMSVGTLPSQTGGIHPSPTFQRQGSSLRPGVQAVTDRPMSAMLPAQTSVQQHTPFEEDITTLTPPRPAFRRSPSSGPANDRPMSMA